MAKLNGHGGYVSFNSVQYQVSKWNLTIDLPELDVTDSNSNGWQNIIIGTKKVSGSFTFFIDAQTLSALISGTSATFFGRIGNTSQKLEGPAFITAVAIDNTVGSPVACTCNLSSTGEWAFGTIA